MWGKLLLLGLVCLLLMGASYEPGRQSSVFLYIDREGTVHDGTCTGTVVGPKTILTAEHCFIDDHTDQTRMAGFLRVDDEPAKPYVIVASDEHDHVLVRVQDGLPAGKRIAKFATEAPRTGQLVYLWGNPRGVRGILRVGYVSGFRYINKMPLVTMVEFHTAPGDSGAGYFNSKGEIIGVHYGSHPTDGHAVGLRLQFTVPQLALAAKP